MYDVNSVTYTTYATVISHKALLRIRRQRPVPLDYDQVHLDDWDGVAEGAFLDIDWDKFAEHSMSRTDIAGRVGRFFARPFSPQLAGAAVCYSPNHRLDSRPEFDEFCQRFADVLNTQVETVPFQAAPKQRPLRDRVIPRPIYNALRSQYYRWMLGLKRMGID